MTFTSRKIREDRPSMTEKVLKAGPAAVRVGTAMTAIFGFFHKRKKEEEAQAKRSRILRRLTVIAVGTCAVVLLFVGTVKALVALKILSPHTLYQVAGDDLPVDENGFSNLLLLGAGDKNHDGIDLTDSMMVASIDPRTRSVLLLSIPRDLFVTKSHKMGTGRINELYRNYKSYIRRTEGLDAAEASKQAMAELALEIGRKTGLTIHRTVKVDFTAFVDTVDALGGVDIDVPRDIVDTEYPGPNYSYQTFEIAAGPQHLDGETALKYARSRHSSSDFDRSARQQQILQALGKKAQELGIFSSPGKILALLKILSEHVETTMTVGEMIGAGNLARSIDRDRLISMQINDRTAPGGFIGAAPRDQFGGAAVLLPTYHGREGGSWTEIRTFTKLLTQNRSTYLAKPQIHILNAGAPAGLARTLAAELTLYGFPVEETGNATIDGKAPKDEDKRPDSVVIPMLPEDEELAEFFATLLEMKVEQQPLTLPPDILGQITIILGENYAFVPMNDLVPTPPEVYPPEETTASGSLSSALESTEN